MFVLVARTWIKTDLELQNGIAGNGFILASLKT